MYLYFACLPFRVEYTMRLFVLSLLFSLSSSLKILVFSPGFGGSHVLFSNRLAQSLTNLGNEVHIWGMQDLDVVPRKSTPAGVTFHLVECNLKDADRSLQAQVFKALPFKEFIESWQGFMDNLVDCCRRQLENYQPLIDRLRNESFDLAISHPFDGCPTIIIPELEIKTAVWVSAGTYIFDDVARIMGIHNNPAYIPNTISKYTDQMTFKQRLGNLFWTTAGRFAGYTSDDHWYKQRLIFLEPPNHDRIDMLDFAKQVYHTVLINGEPSLNFPRPLPHGIPFLGEMKSPKQAGKETQLSKNFQDILAKKSKGLILFSLGTIAKTDEMPAEMASALVDGLGIFSDYTVIMRIEGEIAAAAKYAHIHLVDWLPQRQLLTHPKAKLFITHGGYNSLVEATRAGVPMVLMPLFVDQYGNAMRAVRHGLGVRLEKTEMSPEAVTSAVSTILQDESFAVRARAFATMLDDKVVEPEKVLQHTLRTLTKYPKWFPKLRKPQKMSLMQLYCIDVILFWTASLVVLLASVYKLIRRSIRAFRKQTAESRR